MLAQTRWMLRNKRNGKYFRIFYVDEVDQHVFSERDNMMDADSFDESVNLKYYTPMEFYPKTVMVDGNMVKVTIDDIVQERVDITMTLHPPELA